MWVDGGVEAATPMMSVAKVVQPTATVSSVPVCGPSKYTWTFTHLLGQIIFSSFGLFL